MRYQKSGGVSGAWAKSAELVSGSKCKIVSETSQSPSAFTNEDGSQKMQDVCKVKFEGQEPLNVSLNKTTINGLIEAFGEESSDWQGHDLIVQTEKIRVAGKAATSLYLVPVGFEKVDDENGFAKIVKSDLPF